MGEYEPHDSRIVTDGTSQTPIEPRRTGPREGETRSVNTPQQEEPAEARRQEADETQRWQTDEAESGLEQERVKPGSTRQQGSGDTGRDPTDRETDERQGDFDRLGDRDVEFEPESRQSE